MTEHGLEAEDPKSMGETRQGFASTQLRLNQGTMSHALIERHEWEASVALERDANSRNGTEHQTYKSKALLR